MMIEYYLIAKIFAIDGLSPSIHKFGNELI